MNNSNEQRARRIASLLAGYIRDTLTPAEHDELDEWVGASDKNMRLFEELTDEKRIKLALEILNDKSETGILSELKDDEIAVSAHRRPIFYIIRRYAAAAILVALVAATAIYFATRKSQPGSIDNKSIAQIPSADIKPARDRAFLTLANREVIDLDQVRDGVIATEGMTDITKFRGQISYSIKSSAAQVSQFANTLSTPKGGKFFVVLSDSTKAWMNNESTLTYPAAFTGTERRVVVTGQVYFEVASATKPGPNHNKPFIVEISDRNMAVEVLGTHFDVSAYKEDELVNTTLLEGSVRISVNSKKQMLVPGQQARVSTKGDITVAKVDAESIITWKEGTLQADEEELGSVMNKVGRWFDTPIVFEDNNTNTISHQTFSSTITLNDSLPGVLNTLRTARPDLQFNVEGRKIIVRPS